MRNAEAFRNAAGIFNVLASAARTGAMHCRTMIVKLQRYANNIIAFTFENACHNRGIDAARHGDDNARVFRLSR
jgi:hypothetical protein